MIDTEKNEVWHDVIDLQVWKMTSITDECFENDSDNRYMNSADIEGLIAEVKRLNGEPRMTIDEWNTKPEGPCVTVYIDGCEYVGCLRLYKNADGEVIE